MSLSVFAALLNVGPSTVEHWERGLKKPSGPSLRLLAPQSLGLIRWAQGA